jgi:integrase
MRRISAALQSRSWCARRDGIARSVCQGARRYRLRRRAIDSALFSSLATGRASRSWFALGIVWRTAQRRGDVIRMGRQHIRDGILYVKQRKTGAELEIPVHPDLREILDATPSEHLTFLVNAWNRPFDPGGFSNWFREQCDAAGLPKICSAHGLRNAACRRLAEAGCSAHDIMAISGHVTLAEVQRYTAAADRARLAKRAIATLIKARPKVSKLDGV